MVPPQEKSIAFCLFSKDKIVTKLPRSCLSGDVDMVRASIKNGANPNQSETDDIPVRALGPGAGSCSTHPFSLLLR